MPFSLSSQLPATDRTRCNQNAGRPSRYPSARAAHESSDRPSVEELMANYQFDDALCANPPEVIGIVDDVLTVGNHFRAMSNKLTERFTNASIVGIFVARRRSRMRTSTTLTTPISSRSPGPRAAGKPWLHFSQMRLSETPRELLRVECLRCFRRVEIQRLDAVKLYGPHAIWK